MLDLQSNEVASYSKKPESFAQIGVAEKYSRDALNQALLGAYH